MTPKLLVIGTFDTKGEELAFVAERLQAYCREQANGLRTPFEIVTVDVGTLDDPVGNPVIDRQTVLAALGEENPTVNAGELSQDRGQAISAMSRALVEWIQRFEEGEDGSNPAEVLNGEKTLAGVIGIGGSGGTAIVTAAMRALPIGLPKVMVSTMASGNTAAYVDCSDICMMYSVVDVAGLNVVSRRVLSNAAASLVGMAVAQRFETENATQNQPRIVSKTGAESTSGGELSDREKETVGLTMFGVTTPCVTAIRQDLEADFDCLVFHATGAGGRAMEKLIDSNMITATLDLTTTEIADEIVGGIMPAGVARFETQINKRTPMLISLGAVDMVNFGGLDTVPAHFRSRTLYEHNPQITLMRTTVEENRQIAAWLAQKLNRATAPWTVLFPAGGVSALDAPGQPFHDDAARAALWEELKARLQTDDSHRLQSVPCHINDPAFAVAAVAEFRQLLTASDEI